MAAKPKAPRFSFLSEADPVETTPDPAGETPGAEPVRESPVSEEAVTPRKRPAPKAAAAIDLPTESELVAADSAPVPPAASPAVPAAPVREERRAFSTRLRPSLKRTLDAFVMDLKLAGWPVSQELVLEALVRRLRDDETLRAAVTGELTGPNQGS